MTLVRVALAAALILLAAPLAGEAQPAGAMYRIGWLSPASEASGAVELAALRDGLRELGWVEGRNIVIEARWANGDSTRLPMLARSLVQIKVKIICTVGTPAALAAKQATTKIPIVFGAAAFPERSGLITSYARPGGNVTGVLYVGSEYGKRLEVLQNISPRFARVALLYNDKNPGSVAALNETRRAAESLKVTLQPQGVHDQGSLKAAFDAMTAKPPDAFMTTADRLLQSYRTQIVQFAIEHRLPSMYPNRDFVAIGGLIAYGTSTTDTFRRTATYVDRILRGEKPGDLPIEQASKFDMVINLKTAKTLGLTIPQAVLSRANEILE
jgi:putative ABC transport system substrate-binding protein